MLDAFTQYAPLISALANVGLLLVWLSYFQILLTTYREQKRSSMLLTRGAGKGLDADCVLVNMSQSVIYASQMIVTVKTDTQDYSASISDVRELLNKNEERYLETQAPLKTGETLVLGKFQDFVDLMFRKHFGPDWDEERYADVNAIEITAIANFATFERPVGAYRRFDKITDHGEERMRPATIHTRQIRRRKECRDLTEKLKSYD